MKLFKPAQVQIAYLGYLPEPERIIILIRLFDLQIVNGESYREQSEKRLVRESETYAPRGEIYDRYGKLLVTSESAYNTAYWRFAWTKPDAYDGITLLIDNNGNLWVALWDGASAIQIDKNTKQIINKIVSESGEKVV